MSHGAAIRAEAQSIDPADLSWVNEIIRYIKTQTHVPSLDALHSNLAAAPPINVTSNTVTADRGGIAAAVMIIYGQSRPKEISSWGVSREISHYVSRSALESQVTDKLAHGSTSVIAALKGMGGIGKTVLASHILHTRPEKIKIWFNAESRQRLYEQYETLLLDCDILSIEKRQEIALHPNKTDIVIAAVKRYLAEREDWLVVYDNANTYDEIRDFLPAQKDSGKIIITSQSKDWPKAGLIEVDVMTEAEAIQLLIEIAGEHSPADMAELVKELGYFPLAITQAAAYMVDQRISPKAYLALYKKRETELLKEGSKPADHLNVNVWITFVLALEKIYEQRPLAVALLYYTGWLAANDIPLTLLGCIHYQSNEWISTQLPTIKQALAVLEKYSLLKANGIDDKVVYSIHRVLQKFLQVSVSPEIEKRLLVAVMKGMVDNYIQAGDFEEKIDKKYDQLAWHFEQVDQNLRRRNLQGTFKSQPLDYTYYMVFLHNYANCSESLGRSLKAKDLLEEALEIQQAYFGKNTIGVAMILNDLAIAFGNLGYHSKKMELLEQALAIKKDFYGDQHIEVAKTQGNLANAYGDLGNLIKKKELLEQILPVIKAQDNKYRTEEATLINNLANVYGDLGNNLKKKELLEQSLSIIVARYGEKHVRAAAIFSDLANAYRELNNKIEPKRLAKKALSIFEVHYGKNHSEVAGAMNTLALAYRALSDYEMHKKLMNQVLAIRKVLYGDDHVQVAKAQINVSIAHGDFGDHSVSKKLLEEALPIIKTYYGEDHIEVAKVLGNLAQTLGNLNDFREAFNVLAKAEDIFSRDPGGEQYLEKFFLLKQQLQLKAKERVKMPSSQILNDILTQFKGTSDNLPTAETALRRAAMLGKVKELEFLARHADINAQDNNPAKKMTALHWAIIKGQKASVEVLLRLGARRDIKDASNKTAADYAKESGNSEIKAMFSETQTVFAQLQAAAPKVGASTGSALAPP